MLKYQILIPTKKSPFSATFELNNSIGKLSDLLGHFDENINILLNLINTIFIKQFFNVVCHTTIV